MGDAGDSNQRSVFAFGGGPGGENSSSDYPGLFGESFGIDVIIWYSMRKFSYTKFQYSQD